MIRCRSETLKIGAKTCSFPHKSGLNPVKCVFKLYDLSHNKLSNRKPGFVSA